MVFLYLMSFMALYSDSNNSKIQYHQEIPFCYIQALEKSPSIIQVYKELRVGAGVESGIVSDLCIFI